MWSNPEKLHRVIIWISPRMQFHIDGKVAFQENAALGEAVSKVGGGRKNRRSAA